MPVIRTLVFLAAILLLLNSVKAQAPNYQIDGIVEDTLGNPLMYATVLLLEEADSTLLDFTRTEMDGSFRFKDVTAGDHLVKTTYVGYLPLTIPIKVNGQKKVQLGTLKMSEIASELMEVVIKAAKAPMRMKGDTIEYDASTFKVPEGSTVEDLLRRLPGIEVESDGSILADGKDVNEVTVDGKSFFGSDPKAATKNLPAEGISKVQVFDTKTEEEKITGSTGEAENKTMNLELKEEFKSGGFGKVVAGVGDKSRKELKGNYNKFNDKIQFSLIGVGNNTGRNGLSWDDYQDFMGSQSWNFGSGTDYGFGGRNNRFVLGGNSSSSIEQSVQNLFFSDGQKGFPENYNGGINFNYDHNTNKLSSVYYYNQSNIRAETNMDQDKFYQAFTQKEIRNNSISNKSAGHRLELSFEKEIDSLHSIQLDFNGAYIDENNNDQGSAFLSRDEIARSQTTYDNRTNTSGYLLNSQAIFRKEFKKKGRRAGVNASYLTTQLDENWTQFSTFDLFEEDGMLESREIRDQDNNDNADKQLFKANLLYVEPLIKKFFLQSFYNFRNTLESGSRFIGDRVDNAITLNDDLSRSYENTLKYNRGGTALRYSHNGINIALGAAYQRINLLGDFSKYQSTELLGEVDRQFDQIIPHASARVSINRNTSFNLSYNKQVTEPAIADLQPIVDNLNPLYIREGNPSLVPEISDSYSASFRKNFPMHDTRINFRLRYQKYDNQFSTDESVDNNLVTTYRPFNVEGGSTASLWTFLNFPIIKNKIKVRANYSLRLNKRNSLINREINRTKVTSHSPQVKLDITPSDHMSIYISGSYNLSNTAYDLRPSQNQKTERLSGSFEFNSKLVAGIFISTQMSYDRYSNDRFGLSQSIPIWDSSIYRFFMPDNQLELRFSLYDGLNRNLGLNQSAFGISVQQSQTQTLARYGMLSATYNIRGIKTDVRKKGWW